MARVATQSVGRRVLSLQEAARRAEIVRDKGFYQRLQDGDPEAAQEWREVNWIIGEDKAMLAEAGESAAPPAAPAPSP